MEGQLDVVIKTIKIKSTGFSCVCQIRVQLNRLYLVFIKWLKDNSHCHRKISNYHHDKVSIYEIGKYMELLY